MIVEIGHFALVLALAAALAQTVVPFWGARVGDGALMGVGRSAALTQLALIAIAFTALVAPAWSVNPITSRMIPSGSRIDDPSSRSPIRPIT